MRLALLVVPFLLVAGCFEAAEPENPAPTEDLMEPTWTTRADMPLPRTEVTCATDDDVIWVVGGFNAQSAPVRAFHEYDVAADAWRPLNDFPVPVHHTGLVVHEGILYAFGGYTGLLPMTGLSTVFRYDPESFQWEVHDTLPRPRGAHATLVRGTEVFLVGGAETQPGTIYDSVDVYDLATGQWREGPPLAGPREHMTGAAANGTLVVPGGRPQTFDNYDTNEILGLDDAAWRTAAPIPTARGGTAATAWDGLVFVFGGEQSGGTNTEIEAYDVDTDTWTTYPPMPEGRHGLCAVTVGDAIHVIGGGPQPGLSVGARHDVLVFAGL